MRIEAVAQNGGFSKDPEVRAFLDGLKQESQSLSQDPAVQRELSAKNRLRRGDEALQVVRQLVLGQPVELG